MSKKKRSIILIFVLLAVLLLLTGLFVFVSSSQKKAAEKEKSASASRSIKESSLELSRKESSLKAQSSSKSASSQASSSEPEKPKGPKSPLTGEVLSDPSLLTKRNVAFMIENSHPALPHYGINSAGVIYECPMEGGMTRYMAVFEDYTSLDRIGNLRSCRPYFAYIASEYDAVYVHFGQSVQGEELLATGIVADLNGTDGSLNDIWFRTSDRNSPHNAYTSGKGVDEGIALKEYRTTKKEGLRDHFIFSEKENTLPSGEPCEALSLYLFNNQPYFIYDKSTGLYKRYEYDEPEMDAVDGKQIMVSNIILQDVPCSIYEGTTYLNIPLKGSGKGKFITKGKMIDITWEKYSDTDITRYYMPNGSEIELNPGKTWVSLIENYHSDENNFYSTIEEFNAR